MIFANVVWKTKNRMKNNRTQQGEEKRNKNICMKNCSRIGLIAFSIASWRGEIYLRFSSAWNRLTKQRNSAKKQKWSLKINNFNCRLEQVIVSFLWAFAHMKFFDSISMTPFYNLVECELLNVFVSIFSILFFLHKIANLILNCC